MTVKLLKTALYIVSILLFIVLVMIKPVDYTHYQQQDYYQHTLAQLGDGMGFSAIYGDTLEAGWSKANITPTTPAKLMGYGYKGDYTYVHDSVFVRTVVFAKGDKKIAFISYDLMMVHPALAKAVQKAVAFAGINHCYFSAVHTHHSYGGWATGLGGQLIAGVYDEALVQHIVNKTKQAIERATASISPVSIGYHQYPLPSLLVNRLVADGPTDPFLRVVSLRKKSGKTAVISTFAAHATYTASDVMGLSADYPGAFVSRLEADTTIDFALFAAGGVGSHAPHKRGTFSYDSMARFANRMAAPILAQAKEQYTYSADTNTVLTFARVPVDLGEPQFKISRNWRLRPWLFYMVFGELTPQVTLLQIGDVLFLGFPGDFSGMLYPQLKSPAEMHVVTTSFNGDYVGYIIPDVHYHARKQEAKEMNWFGPYTGSYFVEIANRLIRRSAKP